ncbi:guanylate kinase [Glaciecola sp. KUL10]|uniref:guanylate kinase n=1 Tax=Glaciecola sp. (strain KUL10) TaxID=2161813 RepID=UPI000D782440|nr:guanylate kinase [Glaciecola sp. KUL10]GBL03562.1 guanylate kinase [Glaciecola sp. KUL10]
MLKPLGNLFIIAAPSGAGKSSLISALIEKHKASHPNQSDAVQLSVSHTTRAPRPGETNGVEYYFVSHDEFKAMIANDAFYEHAEVFGNYYGTSKAAIADKLSSGVDIFLDIDWQGARQVKKQNPDANSIFILPPSKDALLTRLINRGQDAHDVIEGRMAQAVSEMSHYNEFDYVILNDQFDEALQQLSSVVEAQRVTIDKQEMRYNTVLSELLKP